MTLEEFEKFGYPYDQVDEEAPPRRAGFALVDWLRLRSAVDSSLVHLGALHYGGRQWRSTSEPYGAVRLAFAPVGVGTSCTVWAYNGKHELLIEPCIASAMAARDRGGPLAHALGHDARTPSHRCATHQGGAQLSPRRERVVELSARAPCPKSGSRRPSAGWEYNELGKMVPVFAQLKRPPSRRQRRRRNRAA